MNDNKEARNKRIARIKINQNKMLGMQDRAVYEAFLERLTGKRSSSKMTKEEHFKVIDEMERQINQSHNQARKALKPMFRKIYSMLKEMDKDWDYANGIAKKMFGVERCNWLTSEQLHKVTAALQIHLNRHQKDTTEETKDEQEA